MDIATDDPLLEGLVLVLVAWSARALSRAIDSGTRFASAGRSAANLLKFSRSRLASYGYETAGT